MITNLEQEKLVEDILNKKPSNENTLFNLLKNGITDNKNVNGIMFPINTLPSGIIVNEKSLTIKTEMELSDNLGYTKRTIIPFTANGDVLEEYTNGYCEIFPSYHIVIVDGKNIKGAYYLDDTIYNDVYINEYGRIVQSSEVRDDPDGIYIKRQIPIFHTLTKPEYNYVYRQTFQSKTSNEDFGLWL